MNATILDGQGAGIISNDDGPPSLSVLDASVTEGDSGTATLTFTVNLGPAAGQTVTVQYATQDGTATSGQDYTATSGTLTFGVGETTKTITVPIHEDAERESAEAFTVTLANPTGGAALGSPAVVTVTVQDTSAAAPTPTPAPVAALQGQDDTDPSRKNTKDNKDVKETQEQQQQQQQREHTNRGNRDDIAAEGNVTEVHLDATLPYIVMANRDGPVIVRLLCGSECPSIRIGDYVEVDGEKLHEQLFEAEQVTVKK